MKTQGKKELFIKYTTKLFLNERNNIIEMFIFFYIIYRNILSKFLCQIFIIELCEKCFKKGWFRNKKKIFY